MSSFLFYLFITAYLKIALCKSPFDLSAPSIPISCWMTEPLLYFEWLVPYINDLVHDLWCVHVDT